MPAQFGVPWHDAIHLSISFVPDGTPVGSDRSDLFHTLDAGQATAAWQEQILRAFQTWAVQAHVNVSFMVDGGQPLGTLGPDQHDPRFGDIRIGARPMSPEVLSISVPHDPFLSGTLSGDVLLNDAVSFGTGNADLFPVLLHEAGHVLGLDHSMAPDSVMGPHLDRLRTSLGPSDIVALQDLYGARPVDRFEGTDGNDRLGTAASFPTPAGYDGSTPLLLYADVTTPRDRDFFSLKAADGYRGPVTFRLQTAGVSLLEPRLTVYDASGHVVADVASQTIFGDTLQVALPRIDPDATYYVEARGATGDFFGVGEYVLAVTYDARSNVGPDAIDRLARQAYSYLSPDDINAIFLDPLGALFHDDHHADDTFATAARLKSVGPYGSEAPARITASLADLSDVDVYKIKTPEGSDEDATEWDDDPDQWPLVMTVTGRATEVNGLMPRVVVFDEDGDRVAALVLAHGGGTYTIQIADVTPDMHYFVRVEADPTSGKAVGNYDLDVEYGHHAAHPTTFVAATLDHRDPQRTYDLLVNQTQFFDLLLATTADAGPSRAAVRMTVAENTGRVIALWVSGAGQTVDGEPILLFPGAYRVTFTAVSGAGIGIPKLAIRLYGASLSDPIGPAADDPTRRPLVAPMALDPAGVVPPWLGSSGEPYLWLALTLDGSRNAQSTSDPLDVPALAGLTNGGPPGSVAGNTSAPAGLGPSRIRAASDTPRPADDRLAASASPSRSPMIDPGRATGIDHARTRVDRPVPLDLRGPTNIQNWLWIGRASGVDCGTPWAAPPPRLALGGEDVEPAPPPKSSSARSSTADGDHVSADPGPVDRPADPKERPLRRDLASMVAACGIATLLHGRIRPRRQVATVAASGRPRTLTRRDRTSNT